MGKFGVFVFEQPAFFLSPRLVAAMAFPMPAAAKKILLVKPKITPPLDPDFVPVVLAKKAYLAATKECTDKLEWALVRADGVGRYALPVFADGHENVNASIYMAGVL